jgi:hypothetical protein
MTITCEEDVNSPVSWCCVDCGINTAPDFPTRSEVWNALKASVFRPTENIATLKFDDKCEVYTVHNKVWAKAGMEDYGGCLCIGCLEQRIGRRLKPKDFADHAFNNLPGTARLLDRRGDEYEDD